MCTNFGCNTKYCERANHDGPSRAAAQIPSLSLSFSVLAVLGERASLYACVGACRHHTKPPVFHETAKYWSCCPHKKAYDWESFMEIKGCAHGMHTDLKQGGLRESACAFPFEFFME